MHFIICLVYSSKQNHTLSVVKTVSNAINCEVTQKNLLLHFRLCMKRDLFAGALICKLIGNGKLFP